MFDSDEKKQASVPANLPIIDNAADEPKEEVQTEKNEKEVKNPEKAELKNEVKKEEQKEKEVPGLEDIFSEGGEVEKPAAFQPIEADASEDWGISEAELKEQNRKKLTMLLLIFVIVILLGIGVYWGFAKVVNMIGSESKNSDETVMPIETEPENKEEKPAESNKVEPVQNDNQAVQTEPGEEMNLEQGLNDIVDNDRDGLTNEEELELGTDLYNVDSDNDALFDREEVKIYRTNPLNPDTDGDGFLDGEEVKAGYNPKGEGRLNVIKR